MKKTRYYLLFLVTVTSLNASILNDFLDTQKIVQTHQNQNRLFEQNPQKSGYFENARFNIEHSNFDDLEKKYEIRAYTKKPGSIQNEANKYKLEKAYIKQMQSWDKNNVLQKRYKVLIETSKLKDLLKLLLKQIASEEKSLNTLSSYVQNNLDIIKLEAIKDRIAKLRLQYSKTQQAYTQQLLTIKHSLANPKITVNEIQHEIQNLTHMQTQKLINFMINQPLLLDPNSNINSVQKKYELNLAKHNLQVLDDKKKIGLDNVEIGYDDGKKSKNALSFGLSFNIPIYTDKTKMIKEKLKLSYAKESLHATQKELNHKILSLKNEIEYKINYLGLLQKEIDRDAFTSSVSEINFNTLKLLLDQKAEKLNIKRSKIETLYEIEEDYLTLLYLTKNIDNQQFKTLMLN